MLTRSFLGNAIENSIWAVAFLLDRALRFAGLLPEFDGARACGARRRDHRHRGLSRSFSSTVDVPMYLARWRAEVANGSTPLSALEGLRDASVRWVVTHDIADRGRTRIPWMSLYFSAAVWSSLALCRRLLGLRGDVIARVKKHGTPRRGSGSMTNPQKRWRPRIRITGSIHIQPPKERAASCERRGVFNAGVRTSPSDGTPFVFKTNSM